MLPGSTAMSQCTPAPPLSFALLSHANTRRKKKRLCQFFESSSNPILAPPFLPSYLTLASFHFSCQVNQCPSVGATCKSGTSPRETVGLTTWKSASAGAAACPGLMSPWRYAAEHAAHSNVCMSACIDRNVTEW